MTATLVPLAVQPTGAPGLRQPAVVVTRRMVIVAAAAVVLAVIHLPWRPRTFCLLRATTGIPCPFCGGTTAMADLGHLNPRDALAASPLGVAMVLYWPFLDVIHGPAWLRPRAVRWPLILSVLAASEVFELFRFHII